MKKIIKKGGIIMKKVFAKLVLILATVVCATVVSFSEGFVQEAGPRVLLFSDIADCDEPWEPVSVLALESLGISYEHYSIDYRRFADALRKQDWEVVIVEAPCAKHDWDVLIDWVGNGGRLLSSLWEPSSEFFTAMGAKKVQSIYDPQKLYLWEPSHPLFTTPNAVPSPLIPKEHIPWDDHGDKMEPLEGAVAYAGFSSTPKANEAATILANEGRTLINGFLFDDFWEVDTDKDGKADIIEYVENQISFLLEPQLPCTSLTPNVLISGTIGKKELTAQESQYCIFVAEGAKLLAIKLESKGNLDLHIRQGKPIERSGSAIIADYSLPSPDGNEFLIIFAPQLKKGPYFIAVENKEDSEQEFTIIATPIFDIQELKGSAEGSVAPNAGLIPFLRQYLATQGGILSLTQYKFDVPGGAKSVTIRLEGPVDKNLDLHLRHDKPVEIVKDQVAADLSVIGPGGQKGVVLAGALLKAGRWYIAVESLAKDEKVDYRVVVEIETGSQRVVTVLEREPKNSRSR